MRAPHLDQVLSYARTTAADEGICELTRLGCQRFLRDLEDPRFVLDPALPEFCIGVITKLFCFSQCSFGFDILDEEFIEQPDGGALWIIRKVRLYEVSVVTFPAYVETAVSARKEEADTVRRRRLDAWKNEMKARMKKC